METPLFHVAIVGAGLGGVAAAIAIARAGHRVTVLEQTAVLGEIGAGIQIPPNSSQILEKWGLLDRVRAVSVEPLAFIFRSYRDGAVLSEQKIVPDFEDHYHAPYLHIHRADYHRILLQEAERLGVTILLGSAVSDVDFDEPSVHVLGKPKFHADVILGADGLKSKCREVLLGRPDPSPLTGDLAYRSVIQASRIRSHPALRDLVAKPAINYWLGPSSHVVCYLLQGGDLCNIVLICPDNNLLDSATSVKADVQEMRDVFAAWDPRLRALLDLVQETSKWKLRSSVELETWTRGKFALLGDACHATLPYLAQGASLALEDAFLLGHLFHKPLTHPSHLPLLLHTYESLRKPRATAIVNASAAFRHVLHMPDGPEQRERDRRFREEEPGVGVGSPNPWADPVMQRWLFGYDGEGEGEGSVGEV